MGSQGCSVKNRAPKAFTLLRGVLLLGSFGPGVYTRPLRKVSSREEGLNGALRSRYWGHMGWRRDHFRGCGKLECKVQHCLTTWQRLQPIACLAALLPKVYQVGELVLGKSLGSGRPRYLGSWRLGGRRHHDQPRVQGPLAASTQSGVDHSHHFWWWSLHKATLQSLKKCIQAV